MPDRINITKYTKNELCTKLALFTRLYRGAQSAKHKILTNSNFCVYLKVKEKYIYEFLYGVFVFRHEMLHWKSITELRKQF